MGEYKRSNYLVDRPFQLRATALIVGLTLLVGVPLGVLLIRTGSEAVALGRESVELGQTANSASTEALKQGEMLNRRLEMEMLLKYGNDEKLLAETKRANALETEKLKRQAEAVKSAAEKFANQRVALEAKQRTLLFGVVGGIAALVLLVGIAGVFFTHKVAGPIHRMRQLFREVSDGKFTPYRPLRKGDELQEFFAEFSTMVERLRERQRDEITHLETAIEKAANAGASEGSLSELRAVRDAMKVTLEGNAEPKS